MDARLEMLRRDPPPNFADALHVRLRARDAANARRRLRIPPAAFAAALSAAAVVLLFAIPSARVSASAFLSRFRVANFVGVRVDPSRFASLGGKQLDLRQLIGDDTEVLEDGGAAVTVDSIDAAEARAGLTLWLPHALAENASIGEMSVEGEHAVRITADTARLQRVLDDLGISDVEVPAALDGQRMTIRVPASVMVRYDAAAGWTEFGEAPSPEVTLPVGVDLSVLGEIGLRILGTPPAEARRFAQAIDWTSTLVVALPPAAQLFRRVDVGGGSGIAFAYLTPQGDDANMILWSSGGRVFHLTSVESMERALEMAQSVR